LSVGLGWPLTGWRGPCRVAFFTQLSSSEVAVAMAVRLMFPVLLPLLLRLSVLPVAAEGKQAWETTAFLWMYTKQYTIFLSSAGSNWG